MNKRLLNLFIFSITLLWAFPLYTADKESLLRELRQHTARSASTWSEFTGKGFKDRILPAPDKIIDYLRKDNQFQGYKERPKKPEIDHEFLSDIVNAFAELPEVVMKSMNQHVVALFLVEELGGTAYGELLRDFDNNKLGFIVLDVSSLNRKANEWISWRANSPFVMKGRYIIEAEIEKKISDDRKAAIQYILLHEVGHLIGVAKGAHPNWITGGHPQKWPFTKLSWITMERGLIGKSKYDEIFTNRNKLKFYAFQNASLTSEDIGETYDQLLKTDFVSLYASTNMYDDFAETYAMYVHVVLQNRPFKIKIIKEGITEKVITNPILEKRCDGKKRYLDIFFK
jgi:hypothetical protein